MHKFRIAAVAVFLIVGLSIGANSISGDRAMIEGGAMPCMNVEPPVHHKYYSVNGAILDFEMQDYIFNMLRKYEMEWYFPTFLCQVYQESRYDQNARAYHLNGTVDVGLCQLKDRYHEEIKAIAGLGPEANLYSDPYANLSGGMALMHRNWTACLDVNTAISAYLTGSVSQYNETYVKDVRKWESTLMEVERWMSE